MNRLWLILLVILNTALAQDITAQPGETLSYAERQAWYALLAWPAHYEQAFINTHGPLTADSAGYISSYTLEQDWTLLAIKTFAGAYQPGYIFISYNARWQEGFLLSFPSITNMDGQLQLSATIEQAGLPTFDTKTGILEFFSKFRGPGDCGQLARYRFVYDSAILIDNRTKACDDSAAPEDIILDPRGWPLLWPLQ